VRVSRRSGVGNRGIGQGGQRSIERGVHARKCRDRRRALGYAAPEIKAGRLVPLLEDWRPRSAAIFLYYPSRRQIPLPLQAFIEFLRENLRAR
jgi:hypothetical protein